MAKFAIFSFFFATLCLFVHSYKAPALFIFGDSLFDAGNNNFIKNSSVRADFFPYGSTFFHHPTGRFTNGRTVVDFLAGFLGLEFQKPYLQVEMESQGKSGKINYPSNGINFASAGSGVLQETNQYRGVITLQVQVEQLQSLVQQNQIEKEFIQNSLILLESGSNDIFNYFISMKNQKLEAGTFIQSMLAEVEKFISQIYELGGRRITVFSVGPVGCVPARALLPEAPLNKCFGRMNRMVKQYNLGLENLVHHAHFMFPGVRAVYGSVYTIVQQFRATPERYGYIEVSRACCGNGPLEGTTQCGIEGYTLCKNPNNFLFWDYFHPSEHTCKLVAKALWAGAQQHIRPINLKTLAALNPRNNTI